MVWRVENARELSGFSPLCAFSQDICSLDGPAEGVKAILDEQRRALFTCPAIGQQSPYLSGIDPCGRLPTRLSPYLWGFPMPITQVQKQETPVRVGQSRRWMDTDT